MIRLTDQKHTRCVAISEKLLVTLVVGSTLVFVMTALNHLKLWPITGLWYSLAFLLLFLPTLCLGVVVS